MAGANACLQGIMLANQLGCQKVIVQSDCMEVINTLNNGGSTSSAAAPIYEDICVQACSFDKVFYAFCPRDC